MSVLITATIKVGHKEISVGSAWRVPSGATLKVLRIYPVPRHCNTDDTQQVWVRFDDNSETGIRADEFKAFTKVKP